VSGRVEKDILKNVDEKKTSNRTPTEPQQNPNRTLTEPQQNPKRTQTAFDKKGMTYRKICSF
jgi:hypothetical protein